MLTVLQVAYPFAPVGPDAVGGAEQILSHLDGALERRGLRSIVVAQEGSQVSGTLIATSAPQGGEIDEEFRQAAYRRHRENIARALDCYPVDLVHMHGVDFPEYLPPDGPPVLVTLHLPPSWYPQEIWQIPRVRPRTYFNCVSRSQQASCPPGARVLPPILNGVPVRRLAGARHARRNFAVALGRICPEKNFHTAIDAAKLAGTPLLLGGRVFPYEAHERYFCDEIQPRLGKGCRYIGPVGFSRKRRLLSAARCLLSASIAPETSSLVAMEALACGCPVIALPSGALPEIVEHGKTGFLVNDIKEIAEAIRAVDMIDRNRCRETALERFSLAAMAERYIELYESLAREPLARGTVERQQWTVNA